MTASLVLMPIVYVGDIDRSVRFFEQLGLRLALRSRTNGWAEFDAAGAILALHISDPVPQPCRDRVELSFVATGPLRDLEARCRDHAIVIERPVTDEPFGRSMVVRDPDGLLIQINEHDVELYGDRMPDREKE